MAIKKAAANKEAEKQTARVRDYSIFVGPMITEKASVAGTIGGRVVFQVLRKASKDEIKAAVERVFGVKVKAVNTANILGKVKRTNRSVGRRAAFKKAYITLAEGHKIDIVEGL